MISTIYFTREKYYSGLKGECDKNRTRSKQTYCRNI